MTPRQLLLPMMGEADLEPITSPDPVPFDGITPMIQRLIDSQKEPGETKTARSARLRAERVAKKIAERKK